MEIFAASYLYSGVAPPLAGGALAVADGRIVDAGPLDRLRREHHGTVSDFPGCVIMPGLVNAHTHLELTHFPSWKLRKGVDYSPRTYVDWIIQVIKIRRSLSRQELEHSVREGLRLVLESGTTAIGEILTDRSLIPLYQESDVSGRLFLEAVGQDPAITSRLIADIEKSLSVFPPGNLLPGLSPHAPHTVSAVLLTEISVEARRRSLPVAIHLAESREESAFMHDSSGKIAELLYPFVGWSTFTPSPRRLSSTAYLDELGILSPMTSVVHAVHVTPADVQLLKKAGVTVVLCPRSNERLAVGTAPVALLKKSGIPLALGTDSLASNDSLSLWDEMRFMRRAYPGQLAPDEVLAAATSGAARALHLAFEVGTLERGKRADFLVMRPGAPPAASELAEALIEESQLTEVYLAGRKH